MPSLTLAGSVTFANDGDYRTSGDKFLDGREGRGVQVGEAEYLRQPVTAPGVDGVGWKTHGYRGRKIRAWAVYVNSSESALLGAMDADEAALDAAAFTASYAGQSFYGCVKTVWRRGPIKNTGFGTYYADLELEINAGRLS